MCYIGRMKIFESRSLEETGKIAAEWLKTARSRKRLGEALIVGLRGHLGAGKTAFVKAVAAALGVSVDVTSPTFVIMKLYETTDADFPRLVHMDAYRLERREELEALRFEDVVSDPHNLVMIEWPEYVGLGLKEGMGLVDMEFTLEIVDDVRRIVLQTRDAVQ